MTKPLEGIRVLDLTNVLAGPFCCHHLAHMGADVIKVEAPGTGDLARQLGADPDRNRQLMGISFLAQNPGKRSITINLKMAEGVAVFKRLIETADVLVENFRPGVMDRLGLGFDQLKKVNPRLNYCAISGFGQDGPLSKLPAYDQIIQGMSGVMSITGDSDTAPLRVGFPVADTIGGLTAAFAVAACLAGRDPSQGRFIDVSMLESVIVAMGWVVSNLNVGGIEPEPFGNQNITASPSGTFQALDGLLNIAANKQDQFVALCNVIDCAHLVDDPRFAERQDRLRNRAELKTLIEAATSRRRVGELVDALNAAQVPAGAVLSVRDALAHPQIRQRGLFAQFPDASGANQNLKLAGIAVKLDGSAPRVDMPPPELGADSDEILRELGLTDDDIRTIRAKGAL
jgi:crotonobetainyl-CoA:carnitine CoA-transferase CaiB-like acyl-CoA transferase